jgi:hypothetical protein|tara:strand:+ start:804 stop:1739 length:936 start_codon:yes stop_codon:yes gene_type:complete
MATQTTVIAIGEREDLSDVITRIDPDETPIYSSLRKETVNNTTFDWLVQELAAASATNYVAEGADASYATPTQAVRFSNVTQISQKDAAVSGTLDSVDTAGRDRETAYQKVLKGLELRRDIEKGLCSDNAKATGATRETANLSSWITNVSVGSGGAAPTGDGSDVPTGGTDRDLSLALIDAAHQAAYEDGGNPNMLVVSPAKKATFSDLSSGSVATNQIQYTAPREAAIVGSVSLYLSDYGELSVVIDRQMGNDRLYLLDSDYASVVTLPGRNFLVEDLAKTGDAAKFQVITEYGLKVSAPKAHGAVYDLN